MSARFPSRSTGEPRESSPPSKTKDAVDLAGLSPPPAASRPTPASTTPTSTARPGPDWPSSSSSTAPPPTTTTDAGGGSRATRSSTSRTRGASARRPRTPTTPRTWGRAPQARTPWRPGWPRPTTSRPATRTAWSPPSPSPDPSASRSWYRPIFGSTHTGCTTVSAQGSTARYALPARKTSTTRWWRWDTERQTTPTRSLSLSCEIRGRTSGAWRGISG
mmetsp:Transcript_26002/g.51827  ORF Transcript_26002/g.51827 Transcript_26002/m.51827 type:complete len:219 (+) Transcript_26002:542-1198(+)